jgi:MFS family permease
MKEKKPDSLWTKDFTIITVGSVISMLGNALTGFSMSLLVLDRTQDTILYALFIFIYTLPQVAVPVFCGPFLDRFSRKRVIYTLDFLSAGIFVLLGSALWTGWFSFPVLAAATFVVGCITSIYTVAYQSFYPLLISAGNYSKAYSVSSTLETISMVGIPAAALIYNAIGIGPLLVFSGLTFLTAAIMETRIQAVEPHLAHAENSTKSQLMQLIGDFGDGLVYIWQQKGLLAIVGFCFFKSLAAGAAEVITLPYFKGHFRHYGEYYYMFIWGLSMVGRVLGSVLHYRTKMPARAKFAISVAAYFAAAALEGTYLYVPLLAMTVMTFTVGLLDVTSYNIRLSGTQSYVPDERKGRFNGIFATLSTGGMLLGQILAGAAEAVLNMRTVLSCFMGLCALAALVLIGLNKKYVAPILNAEV